MKNCCSILAAGVFMLTLADSPAADRPRTWDFDVGVGPMAGHTTYQVGGTVKYSDGSVEEYWFPISELIFPLDVQHMTLDTTLGLGKERRLQLSLGGSKNLTTDAGKMEDSDWITEWNPRQLDIYSESDAELDALMLSADVLYRFLKKRIVSVGAGVGFFYQELNYECSDFVQTYPSEPWWPADTGAGLGIIYDVTYYVPYLQVRADVHLLKDRLRIGVNLAVSPYLTAKDYDNHVLRELTSDGDYDGAGGLGSLEFSFLFNEHWFVEGRLEGKTFSADGSQKTYYYGHWSHTIDAEITSDQASFTLALGAAF